MPDPAPPPRLTEHDWQRHLTSALATPVTVRYSRARKTVIRTRHTHDALEVTMQRFFAKAPEHIVEATEKWLRSGRRARRASRILDDWIEAQLEHLWREHPRANHLEPTGRVHDLRAMAAELKKEEFAATFESDDSLPAIGWGRAGKSRTRHSLRLGSYDALARSVRVHSVLDQESVPAWFVKSVLFHELLHAATPVERGPDGRRILHGPVFRGREASYADSDRARVFEDAHIAELIRSARTGRPARIKTSDPVLAARTQTLRTNRRAAHSASAKGALRWVQRQLF